MIDNKEERSAAQDSNLRCAGEASEADKLVRSSSVPHVRVNRCLPK